LLRELASAQPLPVGVTVTAATLGGVPTAEITVGGIEPRHVVLYFHSGVYVLGDAFQAAGLASQVGRRTSAKVISVDYRLGPEHPYPAAVDDALAAYQAFLQDGTAPPTSSWRESPPAAGWPSPPWSTPAITGRVSADARPARPSTASEATAGTAASAAPRARNERRFVADIVVPFKSNQMQERNAAS